MLETERLLKEKQTASGKTKEEAVMLLNHKDALDFILDAPNYLNFVCRKNILLVTFQILLCLCVI